MPELFDFSKHLRGIVLPKLKVLGFVQKGTKFLRTRGDIQDEIEFQCSQWNGTPTGDPFRLFINLK